MTQNTYLPKDYDTFIGIDVDKNSFAFTVKDHGAMNRAKIDQSKPYLPRQVYIPPADHPWRRFRIHPQLP